MMITLQTLTDLQETRSLKLKAKSERLSKFKIKAKICFLDTLGILTVSIVVGILFTLAYRFGYNV